MDYQTLLAIERTKLANHRTYLAYMRTGFVISGIAGHFKYLYIVLFGLLMIFLSTIQYYYLNNKLDKKIKNNNTSKNNFDVIPIIYLFLSISILYLQYTTNKK